MCHCLGTPVFVTTSYNLVVTTSYNLWPQVYMFLGSVLSKSTYMDSNWLKHNDIIHVMPGELHMHVCSVICELGDPHRMLEDCPVLVFGLRELPQCKWQTLSLGGSGNQLTVYSTLVHSCCIRGTRNKEWDFFFKPGDCKCKRVEEERRKENLVSHYRVSNCSKLACLPSWVALTLGKQSCAVYHQWKTQVQ